MSLFTKVSLIKNLITRVFRMGQDIEYILTKLDDLESTIIEVERDLTDLPELILSMSESYSFLANRVTSMEQSLIEKKVIKEDELKRMLN